MPPTLQVALKEWASVCRAMSQGRQLVLLRKGGIHESAGEFELEHSCFAMFPTYLHQSLRMLKPAEQATFEPLAAEPEQVKLTTIGEVADILRLKSRAQMDRLDRFHVWTAPLIDMRFSYRPENPLYLILVRAYVLAEPVSVENTLEYAGCKSWVPLNDAISTANARAAVADADFASIRAEILSIVR